MSSGDPGGWTWRNPPPAHDRQGDKLTVRTGPETDWWNNTFYGFLHLNGHFLGKPVTGDFTLVLTFTGAWSRQYDQAGAMVYVDDTAWMKCGVEFTEGTRKFSVVVTRGDQSDWAVRPLGGDASAPVTLRVTRHAEALRIDLRDDDEWVLVRLCYLPMGETVEAGPMACSPSGENLEVSFSGIEIGPAIDREMV